MNSANPYGERMNYLNSLLAAPAMCVDLNTCTNQLLVNPHHCRRQTVRTLRLTLPTDLLPDNSKRIYFLQFRIPF